MLVKMGIEGSMVQGIRPSSHPARPSVRNLDVRECTHPGCVTRLSSYNKKATCYVHTPMVIPRSLIRGSRAKKENIARAS